MKTLWFLHGNLQQPDVWQPFMHRLRWQYPGAQIATVNLWETLVDSAWSWARAFCHTVRMGSIPAAENYIVSYSLGGRLAMHALLTEPELWSGAMIVSADPGTADRHRREQCLSRDRIWAHRFLTEPWDALLAEWDALPVFCHRPCPTPRLEADFDRQKIARAFEVYSKGRMDDVRSHITTLSIPITYVTGEADHRYHQIGTDLAAQSPHIRHISLPNAGHRVPWEQPQAFFDILTDVLA